MPLTINNTTYLISKEAAHLLDLAPGSFRNLRSEKGDAWLKGHADLVVGRTFYRLDDVERLARERAR